MNSRSIFVTAFMALVVIGMFFATRTYFVKKEMIKMKRLMNPVVEKNLDVLTKRVISLDRVEMGDKRIYVYLNYKTDTQGVRYSVDVKERVTRRLEEAIEKWCDEESVHSEKDIKVRFSDDFD